MGLPSDALDALAKLEASTIAADGGRLKLEWGVLNARVEEQVSDILWWEKDELVGFVGLYAFGSPTVEITGMVDPQFRRQGIGAALLSDMLQLCRDRDHRQVLLVAPRSSAGARVLATSRRGILEHSEHALVLDGRVAQGPSDPTIALRRATQADVADVGVLLTKAFGHPWNPLDLEASDTPTMVAERGGLIIATLRVHRDPGSWGIYGFAVSPLLQGRGIGRDLLRRVCREANEAGVNRVHLEVSVDNERALSLYTSLGFSHEATEDYYDIPL
jgi:ribosomal protein S18 acetylase RimI-like enzyme